MHVSCDPADLLRPRSSAAWTRIAPSRTRFSLPTRIGAQKPPFGAFETPPFEAATFAIAKTVGLLCREGKLKAIAGGGDTVAALNEAGVAGQFTYVSAAGGAFLEWMEGKALPGVEALRAN